MLKPDNYFNHHHPHHHQRDKYKHEEEQKRNSNSNDDENHHHEPASTTVTATAPTTKYTLVNRFLAYKNSSTLITNVNKPRPPIPKKRQFIKDSSNNTETATIVTSEQSQYNFSELFKTEDFLENILSSTTTKQNEEKPGSVSSITTTPAIIQSHSSDVFVLRKIQSIKDKFKRKSSSPSKPTQKNLQKHRVSSATSYDTESNDEDLTAKNSVETTNTNLAVVQLVLTPGLLSDLKQVKNKKNNNLKKSNSTKLKTKESFTLRNLANRLTSGAVNIRHVFNNTNKRKKSQSTFYSDISVSTDVKDSLKRTDSKRGDHGDSNSEHSINTDDYEDFNSSLSQTNLSEKSSINLNEHDTDENNLDTLSKSELTDPWTDNDEKTTENEYDSYYLTNNDSNINDDANDSDDESVLKSCDTIIDLNDFWESVCFTDPKNYEYCRTKISKNPFLSESSDDLHPIEYCEEPRTRSLVRRSSSVLTSILWSQLPDVKESGLIDKMTNKEVELQERWFEILHSELSYNKTLSLLNNLIIPECKKELSDYNLNMIFTRHIDIIMQISDKLIDDLQCRIQSCTLIQNLFDILYETFNDTKFRVYAFIAGEQASQKENLDRLMKENKKLAEIIQKIRNDRKLQGKDISTFLIAPIQRLPRYKLLAEAVMKLLTDAHPAYQDGLKVVKLLETLLLEANDRAKKYASIAESIKLKMLLQFDSQDLTIRNLVSAKRDLLYHGDLISLNPISYDNVTLPPTTPTRKTRKSEPVFMPTCNNVYHLILFSDILIIAIKTFNDEKNFYYRAMQVYDREKITADLAEWKVPLSKYDSCPTAMSSIQELACSTSEIVADSFNAPPLHASYLLTVTVKPTPNHDDCYDEIIRKPLDIKYCFICSRLVGDEWIKYLNTNVKKLQEKSDSENEFKNQAVANFNYETKEANELELTQGELVKIIHNNEDTSMYYGERLRDTKRGWFPMKHVTIIRSDDQKLNGLFKKSSNTKQSRTLRKIATLK